MDPMPKRCHHCKSEDHLIENCPTLPDEKKRTIQNPNNGDQKSQIEQKQKPTKANKS